MDCGKPNNTSNGNIEYDGELLTPEYIKFMYEKNKNTNEFTDEEKARLDLEIADSEVVDIWSYYYYADPAWDRTVIVDPISMKLIGWIPTTPHGHPGSTDRAGYTDRAYVRTTGPSSHRLTTYDVVDARTRQFIKAIHLPDPDDPTKGLVPRGCGTFNKYQNLQIISHKLEPMATVIDVRTDRPAAKAVGRRKGTETIDANLDGNATGHSNWLDAEHFTLLDRYHNTIEIFNIVENPDTKGDYIITPTDRVHLPCCTHVIDEDVQDQSLSRNVYWSADRRI